MKEFNFPSDWSNEDIRLFQAIESAEKLSCLTPCGQDRKEIGACTCDHICNVRENVNYGELMFTVKEKPKPRRRWAKLGKREAKRNEN